MIAELYGIRPWEMGRLTTAEWNQIANEMKRRNREARKRARAQ